MFSCKEYQCLTKELWDIPFQTERWFPDNIYKWINCRAGILGVPHQYISFPLLVSTAFLSGKTNILADEHHVEPLILYGIVGGASGTNKTGVLKLFQGMVENITGTVIFDSGTNDGLIMALKDNNGCCLTLQDEFANFMENLDKTTNSIEKKRLLSMYNENPLNKVTKTGGYQIVKKPHFNIFGFTQVENFIDLSRDRMNIKDGFIQRFMLSVPKDVYIF